MQKVAPERGLEVHFGWFLSSKIAKKSKNAIASAIKKMTSFPERINTPPPLHRGTGGGGGGVRPFCCLVRAKACQGYGEGVPFINLGHTC